MAKSKTAEGGSLIQEMFQVGLYKRSQGRVARQVTFAAAAITVALGSWSLMQWLGVWLPSQWSSLQYVISGGLLFLGCWIAYRVVNYPQFADFLIAVEAEMAKVSWPSRAELVRSSLVVIIVIFVLAGVLFSYDIVWNWIFTKLGFLQEASKAVPQ
jgi:preprotein translocase subunit SecE